MENQNILKEFERIKALDDNTVFGNIRQLCSGHDHEILEEFFYFVENTIFDAADREIYNALLGRKPISWSFNPTLRKRAEAILAILSSIKP